MKSIIATIGILIATPAFAGPVEIVRNVSYYDGADRDPVRHRLDLYLPTGVAKFPTVMFVHGGGWTMGSKDGFLALPGHKAADHGRFFAERGIAAVFISYRLSPLVKHPEHVIDVARAFAWTRRNLVNHGGDADQLFVMGHSAGGHLVSLLASDPKYLMAEGLTPNMIRGVIPISGVFALMADVGPAGGDAPPAGPAALFTHVFGKNIADHRSAAPISHVHRGMPPFLIAYADRDMLTLPAQAVAFHEVLTAQGNNAKKMLIMGRTHQSILKETLKPEDSLAKAILAFVRSGKP